MNNEKNQLKVLKEISLKMDALIKLTAIQALGSKKKVEAVGILTDLGFTEGQIADLLNTTSGSVNRMRQYIRTKNSQPQKNKTKGEKNPVTTSNQKNEDEN